MRITGGLARGILLKAPPGDAVRPATDGTRQAVFSSLAPRLAGVRFLDLFAGSGTYGLEALSRGAASGVFVEKNAKAAACLRDNLALVCKSLNRPPAQAGRILVMDASTAPLADEGEPELVFIDQPYDLIEPLAPTLFARLTETLPLRLDPLIIFEMPGELELAPAGWTCVKRLGKGRRQPSVCFFRRSELA